MSAIVIYYRNGRKHIFFTDADQKAHFLSTIGRNMVKYLGLQLTVTEECGIGALNRHTLIRMEDSLQDIIFSTIVSRVKRAFVERPVKLVCTKDGIYHVDINSSIVLSFHNFANVHALVRMDNQLASDSSSEHLPNQFMIEFDNDRPYLYRSALRDAIITSIAEFCERRKFLVCINFSKSLRSRHVGSLSFIDEDYDEILMKRISSVKTESPNQWLTVLLDFNENFHLFKNSRPKDKKPLSVVLDILHRLVQTDIDKKANMRHASITASRTQVDDVQRYTEFDLPPKMAHYITVALQTLQRLLTIPVINECVASQAQDFIFLFRLLQFNDPVVSYLAGSVLRMCIDQMFDHRTERREHMNKLALMKHPYNGTIIGGDVPKMADTIDANVKKRREPSKPEAKDILFAVLRERHKDEDYTLTSHAILSVLESLMHSGVSSTDRSLFVDLFTAAMKQIDLLFNISFRSQSRSIGYLSSLIMKVVLENCTKDQKKFIQDKALKKTLLIRALHVCFDCLDHDQLACSGLIIGHLAENHHHNLAVLRRTLPRMFFNYLQSAVAKADMPHQIHRKLFSPAKRMEMVSLGASHLELAWPSMAIQLMQDHHNLQLIWNQETRTEIRQAIINEIATFEKALDHATGNCDIVWNHFEFQVDYHSTSSEPRIGDYYLNYLLENTQATGIGKNDEVSQEHMPMLFLKNLIRSSI